MKIEYVILDWKFFLNLKQTQMYFLKKVTFIQVDNRDCICNKRIWITLQWKGSVQVYPLYKCQGKSIQYLIIKKKQRNTAKKIFIILRDPILRKIVW